MKEIYINADDYNTDSIKTIQGNNNAEVYKLYLQYDNEKIDLTGKTVNLAFLRVGSTDGDIIENLNVTNAKEGEITLKITNKLTKKNGTYSCQLAILGEGDFLEHTATFTLTVENNIFSDITKAIADSKDFTYLERILGEAKTVSGELKETVDSVKELQGNIEIFKEANTLVKDLNDNTLNANNANSKLIENTSKAESVSASLDSKNIEANKKIEKLEELNHKAEELNSSISNSLTSELVENIKEANNSNITLSATNKEATTKSVELNSSLEEAKKYIAGLDGSQNIPQIRMELTELQGLKNNQFLAYQGAYIDASNTLVGRTESMRVKGKTMYKKADGTYTDTWEEGVTLESFGEKEGNKISILSHGKNLVKKNSFTNDEIKKWSNSDESYYVETIVGGLKKGTVWGFIESNGDIRYELSLGNNPIDITNHESIGNTRERVIQYMNSSARNTLDKDYKYAVISVRKLSQSASINKVMISNIETSYEPYKCYKKDILIKEPLRSKDDKCDILYEDNGQVKIDRYVGIRKYQEGDEKNKDVTTDKINTVYILDKPVTEIVENCVDIDLDTFGEKTYFNIENSIKGSLDFKVPSNIASIVQSNSKAINELYNLIDTLVLPNILQNTTDIEMLKLEKLK
ncbi:BppU family phage baseplate upper protein [Clostridium perfringens]|uniref:BppU family phage baseplate upper protein n=1 Tax=Clostridium perfringens TaxID=1502 RepID=UPI0021A45230|nr:BppU family phage baseplate upper protein [Clostridium perfringens]